jgi:bacteriophage N4 adsorption protein B
VIAASLVPLACWILLSGLDDLFVAAIYLARRRRPFPWPTDSDLEGASERRIAILVPLWREHAVIGRMLEHNLSVLRYANYDVFVGVYPNDELTVRAVRDAESRYPRVHLAMVPHNGPTSKGDCLNWIYAQMAECEAQRRVRFDVVVTHDAEDLIHADSLRLINWFSRDYDMVQIPVLPLATPRREFTHGLYCDEFAEYQQKDIPVRQMLGGFLPSNGVGTGFGRAALERLAATRGGRICDPTCLTEDYENGFRLHELGATQIFVPIRWDSMGPIATREYFPRNFHSAVRQRSRWVAGIVLQGWQQHGWRSPPRQLYWLWRDRKGAAGNLLSPLANALFLYMVARWAASDGRWHPTDHMPLWVARASASTLLVSAVGAWIRATCCARIYGWRMAALSPVRLFWGNAINGVATAMALWQFAAAAVGRGSLAWRKTDHAYPRHRSRRQGRPLLGEVLVRMRSCSREELEAALRTRPAGQRLGEHLISRRVLSEDQVYRALSAQSGIAFGLPPVAEWNRMAARSLPLEAVRKWKVLPYRISVGQLHVLTPEVPTEEMTRDLEQLSALEIRFRLVRPAEFDDAAAELLTTEPRP